ncbi:hypothetical protein BTO02_07195 [Paraburkholderia sp. SOS3]|nr:hypothetical protein BTO02_07195 [Paraburkholderia sp. SOS3]
MRGIDGIGGLSRLAAAVIYAVGMGTPSDCFGMQSTIVESVSSRKSIETCVMSARMGAPTFA